ncbi:MAG TPA: hypothetical protein VM431_06485 [Phycisphaerae bacterium]|nr:hypothetical protein [Phycisphaerae bacterium]
MEKIAAIISTAPLRKTTTRHGITKQRLNMEACLELARRFDLIIIASLSADEVFEYIDRHLPAEVRPKFRLYSRTFFHSFRTDEIMRTTDDPRSPGWQQILSENGIEFEVLRSRIGSDHRHRQERFAWDALTEFITDERVTLVTGGEGQLLYDSPKAAGRRR